MTKEAIKGIHAELEKGEIEELYLDNIKIEKISDRLKQEIESIEELMCLSLNDCNLVSLANFPHCKNLIRLEIMDNKFPARELQHLSHLASLQSLSLGANNWVQLGPTVIPNGQGSSTSGARVNVTGRITAIVVDPMSPSTMT